MKRPTRVIRGSCRILNSTASRLVERRAGPRAAARRRPPSSGTWSSGTALGGDRPAPGGRRPVPGRVELDGERRATKTGASSTQDRAAPTKSKSALAESVRAGVLRLAQVQHRHARDVVEVQAGRRHVEHVGGDHQLDARALELPREVAQATRVRGARCRSPPRAGAGDARAPRRSRACRHHRESSAQPSRLAIGGVVIRDPHTAHLVSGGGVLGEPAGELGAADARRRRRAPSSCAAPVGTRAVQADTSELALDQQADEARAGTPSRGRYATPRSCSASESIAMTANTRNVATMTRRYSSGPCPTIERTARLVDLQRQPTKRQPGPVRARRRTRPGRPPAARQSSRSGSPERFRARAPGRRGRRGGGHERVVDASRWPRQPRRPADLDRTMQHLRARQRQPRAHDSLLTLHPPRMTWIPRSPGTTSTNP